MAIPKSVRSQIERMTRWIVFARKFPPPFEPARIFVTPAARLGYVFRPLREAEPHLLHCAEALVQRGQTIWDIGANIGIFTFAAAARAGAQGRVFAFEPDLRMASLLRRSAAVQPSAIAPVDVVPVAVAKTVALRKFSIAERAAASNALAEYGGTQMGSIARSETVPAVTLDWLLTQLPPPHAIKIDVEGAEFEVLDAQREMLERVRPAIICEVGGTDGGRLTELFAAARYRLFDGDMPLRGAAPVTRVCWNTVALPEEKTQLIA